MQSRDTLITREQSIRAELEILYRRKAAVDDLIRSMEEYMDSPAWPKQPTGREQAAPELWEQTLAS